PGEIEPSLLYDAAPWPANLERAYFMIVTTWITINWSTRTDSVDVIVMVIV
ncbi:hypothetical protein L916_00791, partial [Phytophthora nicotianae]